MLFPKLVVIAVVVVVINVKPAVIEECDEQVVKSIKFKFWF